MALPGDRRGSDAGRIAGTLFHCRIDESDREMTHLVVELAILCVEDLAASIFLVKKRRSGVRWTRMDQTNFHLALACWKLEYLLKHECIV